MKFTIRDYEIWLCRQRSRAKVCSVSLFVKKSIVVSISLKKSKKSLRTEKVFVQILCGELDQGQLDRETCSILETHQQQQQIHVD